MKIIDISQEILNCRVYPGDPVPCGERIASIDKGSLYNLSKFSMCAHNGTHTDAPFHFLQKGKTIDQIPLEYFVGECYVANCKGELTGEDAQKILQKARELNAHKRILIAGDAVVTKEAAVVFSKEQIFLIGNESQSIGPEGSPMEVHRILMEKNIVLLEGLILKNISDGKYFLSAAPLNIAGFDGAPCRAYLIKI